MAPRLHSRRRTTRDLAVTATKHLSAVYPGTFDPMTLGHEDLMRRASRLFDRLILAVAAGHHKRTMFTIAERLEIAKEIAKPYGNVEVTAFRGLLRDFVVENGGQVVVRGLRAVSDFEYEFQMAGMNRQLMPEVETVFMTAVGPVPVRQRHLCSRNRQFGRRRVEVRCTHRAAAAAGTHHADRMTGFRIQGRGLPGGPSWP